MLRSLYFKSSAKLFSAPPTVISLWALGSCLLLVLYCLVFYQTTGETLSAAVIDALANVAPLAMLSAGLHAILRMHVIPRSVPVQAAAHAGLSLAFATTWYALVLVVLAFAKGLGGGGFAVSGFSGPAFTWQVFQGLILYAAVAATCYAVRGGRDAAAVTIISAPLERYLTKAGDEIVPVNVREIVSIAGAQDYSEVRTTSGRHLVRLSLNEFEQRLDPARFVRVHRSTIINLDRLTRVEPAGGGRMTAHMSSGDVIQVSRTGSQTLRTLMM